MTDELVEPSGEAGPRIEAAFARLYSRLEAFPRLRERVAAYLRALSPSGDAADYFRQPRTYPLLTLPVWVEEALTGSADPSFHDDLVYSTIAGYCHIRLLDDVMDDDRAGDASLLPLSGLFHAEFQGTYARTFAPAHPFWSHFASLWYGGVDATIEDAHLATITFDQFRTISAAKVSPAKIPIVATCLRLDQADALGAWLGVCDRLACVAQMTDDLFDWMDDRLHAGRTTYFLSEAERRRSPGEPATAWILRDGLGWATGLIHGWYAELHTAAAALGSGSLQRHLTWHEAELRRDVEELTPGSRALGELAAHWPASDA